MLFNSYFFLFLFLPVALAGYCLLSKRLGRRAAVGWLVLASLVYYGWWNPKFLTLIVGSIVANYFLGNVLAAGRTGEGAPNTRKPVLILGIVLNLALLFYFKYAGFFLETMGSLDGSRARARPEPRGT